MERLNHNMLVLNCYGKINRTCISKKLGMYLSNLPAYVENNWKNTLKEQLGFAKEAEKLVKCYLNANYSSRIFELYRKVFPYKEVPREFIDANYEELANMMICVTLEYDYDDMPLGGWETNCFEGRFCEDDYAEKIINFMNFLAYSNPLYGDVGFPVPVPQWTYSSNHDELDYYRIFWGGENVTQYLNSMLEWGKLFDDFLISRERYSQLDYLINSIYKDAEYNEYHLVKDFSLCQLALEKKWEGELDIKLQRFLPESLSDDEKQRCAKLLRQLRNKIAHGDFVTFEEKIEEYAVQFLDGKFVFDYSEYSRKNWTIGHICCLLDDILRRIFYMMFYDYRTLESIKKG